jgi:regulator of protease activity HflC (stomatin/prohibitin superfamily)
MIEMSSATLWLFVIIGTVFVLANTLFTVDQGVVAVVTRFGKYTRMNPPGLNVKIPFIEKVSRRISIQNRAVELVFQAITLDQANVNFKAMLLFAVFDQHEDTIKNVAFKFIDNNSLMQALVRTVEGSVRSFVATKRQSEILLLRRDIVESIKTLLDASLESWGYHLIDLQINDISFDEEIMKSMAQVVASSNLKAAAENQGQALLITKTKEAEADGNAIKIAAEAERTAAQLRGQGVALFREEVARGMSKAAGEMKDSGLDVSVILFSMWTDAIKHFAENGQGNMIFLDGSSNEMQRTMTQMMGITQNKYGAVTPNVTRQ